MMADFNKSFVVFLGIIHCSVLYGCPLCVYQNIMFATLLQLFVYSMIPPHVKYMFAEDTLFFTSHLGPLLHQPVSHLHKMSSSNGQTSGPKDWTPW